MAGDAAGDCEPQFRIRVCMKRFFADERARCWLQVGARRRVRWLARRLRTLFALPPRLSLLCRGHLLPRDEPLALLERDDLVEVIPRRAGKNRDSRVSRDDVRKKSVEDQTVEMNSVEDDPRPLNENTSMDPLIDPPSNGVRGGLTAFIRRPSIALSPVMEHDKLRESKLRALAALEQLCGAPVAPSTAEPNEMRGSLDPSPDPSVEPIKSDNEDSHNSERFAVAKLGQCDETSESPYDAGEVAGGRDDEHVIENVGWCRDAPRSRRRRVRRRRRAPGLGAEEGVREGGETSRAGDEERRNGVEGGREEGVAECAVLRNGAPRRAARIVAAFDDGPPTKKCVNELDAATSL